LKTKTEYEFCSVLFYCRFYSKWIMHPSSTLEFALYVLRNDVFVSLFHT